MINRGRRSERGTRVWASFITTTWLTPHVLLCVRRYAHTMQTIIATGEFIVNFPSYYYADDILEACRFYPKGVNEDERPTDTTELQLQLHLLPDMRS
jgi:flavin reductase (DIM6/NTAB) family NADH-FMN oxidoreductase RutF